MASVATLCESIVKIAIYVSPLRVGFLSFKTTRCISNNSSASVVLLFVTLTGLPPHYTA
ncbi:hypothetical protein LC607_15040 [Nostoc sp. CHAB 5824]|nr:hypothetical protein [Nostoc sp. CHAB 5824]